MSGHHSFAAGGARIAVAAVLLIGALPASRAQAQSISRRVTDAPDGEVRFTYATRAGVCGDGRNTVALGHAFYVYPNMEGYGRFSGIRCEPGPARAALTVRGGEVTAFRPRVGGSWGDADGRITDLGTVSAADAARYFFSLARSSATPSVARRALLGAAIADSVSIAPEMLALGGEVTRNTTVRTAALHWAGQLGDASVVRSLESIARGDEEFKIRDAAVAALAQVPDDGGTPALIGIARSDLEPRVRKTAAFWLGQSENPKAHAALRDIIRSDDSIEVRSSAIFALGQGEQASDEDINFLRDIFPSLHSDKLADQVLMAMGQSEDPTRARWVLSVARDQSQSTAVRKKAIFWAGQGHASMTEMAQLYDGIGDRALREQVIFALSQRDDPAATDKLVQIARSDPDHSMRKKALFWLTQKDDPRVTKMITDLLDR
jgi:HEAT repeat protein